MRQYSPSCDTSGSTLNECTVLTLLTPVRLRGEKWGYVNSRCDGSAVVLTQPCVCTLKLHFKPLFLRHVYQGASLCSLRKLQPSSPRGAEGRGGCGAREALRTFLLLESRSLRTVPNCSKYCRSCGSHSPRGRCPTYTTPGVSSSCGAQQPRHRGTDRDRTGQVGSALPAPHSPRPPGSYGHAAPSSGPCSAAAAPGTKTTLAPLRLPPPPPCCSTRRDCRKCVILPRGGVARQQERAGAERAPSPSNGALLAPLPPRATSPSNRAASPRSAAFARAATAQGGALTASRRDSGRCPPSPLPRRYGLSSSRRQALRGAARRRSGTACGSPARRDPLGGPRGGSRWRRRAPCQ